MNDLIIKSDAPNKIDFLSLDVESAEIEMHNGIDYNNYIFKYMLIKSRNFETINNFLKIKNYIFLEKLSDHDYLFDYIEDMFKKKIE